MAYKVHKVAVYANSGATAEKAPFLGQYVSNGTDRLDQLAVAVAAYAGQGEIQAQTIIAGVFDAIADYCKTEGATRFKLPGGFRTWLSIEGTLASSNSRPGADNKVKLNLGIDAAMRNALVNEVPAIVTAADTEKVRIDRIFDLVDKEPQSTVYGQRSFRVQGQNIVNTDPDADIYVLDGKGTRYEVEIDEVISSQELTMHMVDNPKSGRGYRLVAKTRGGNPDAPLQTVDKPFTFIAAVPVIEIDNITDDGAGATDGVYRKGNKLVATGQNLQLAEGERVLLNGMVGMVSTQVWIPYDAFETNTPTRLVMTVPAEFNCDSGQTITLSVKGVNHTATYEKTEITAFYAGNAGPGVLMPANFPTLEGSLMTADEDHLPLFSGVYNGETRTVQMTLADVTTNTETKLVMRYTTSPTPFQFDDNSTVIVSYRGTTATAIFNPTQG